VTSLIIIAARGSVFGNAHDCGTMKCWVSRSKAIRSCQPCDEPLRVFWTRRATSGMSKTHSQPPQEMCPKRRNSLYMKKKWLRTIKYVDMSEVCGEKRKERKLFYLTMLLFRKFR